MEITITSANDVTRTLAIDTINAQGNRTTFADVCHNDAVVEFFDEEPDAILESLCEINGSEVTDGLRDILLNSPVTEGAVLGFDIEVEEEEQAPEQGGEARATGARGVATVYLNGGFNSVNIEIADGVTTAYEAIYNDAVRGRSGYTDAQLSNCGVILNDDQALNANALNSTKLHHGDTLTLSVRPAHTKGL